MSIHSVHTIWKGGNKTALILWLALALFFGLFLALLSFVCFLLFFVWSDKEVFSFSRFLFFFSFDC